MDRYQCFGSGINESGSETLVVIVGTYLSYNRTNKFLNKLLQAQSKNYAHLGVASSLGENLQSVNLTLIKNIIVFLSVSDPIPLGSALILIMEGKNGP